MDRRPRAVLSLSVVLALALLVPAGALAKGKPTTEATNNLSVPAIMLAGGSFTGVTCGTEAEPSVLVPPTGDPQAGFPIGPLDYYYVQGVNKWQAQCYVGTTGVPVVAGWGDNLTGDAKLKTGSPIRVELGLFHDTLTPLAGYTVVKLDPAALDRESKYGTLATADGAGGFSATPTLFGTLRVFDKAVTLTITNVATGSVVVSGPATAEINATGNIVYGYNLRVSTAGQYEIKYVVPTAVVTGADAGAWTDHSVTLVITVTGGGGGRPRP